MNNQQQEGYILPTIVIFSIVLLGSLMVVLQYVAAVNSTVLSGVSSSLAQQAAGVGVSRAISCAEKFNSDGAANPDTYNPNSAFSGTITAETNCNGSPATGGKYIANGDGVRSEYQITKSSDSVNDQILRLNITGKSDRLTPLGALLPNSTYNRSARVDIPVKSDVSYSIEPGSASYFATNVDVGNQHVCAVISQRAYCWGGGVNHKLGNGSTANQNQPTKVMGALTNTDVRQVSAGEQHSCAVTTDNQLYCWGLNSDHQMGLGQSNTSTQVLPVYVNVPGGVQQVSAGSFHTCAINLSGKLYCWGKNYNNRLGVADDTQCGFTLCDGYTPLPVHDKSKGGDLPVDAVASQISAGDSHTCAIAASPTTYAGKSQAYCWGDGSNYRGGWGSTARQPRPYRVPFSTTANVTRISAGNYHTCAIANKKVYCWGEGSSGQIGDGSQTDRSALTPAINLPAVSTDITVGEYHSCSLSGTTETTASLYCWGRNGDGQLGRNTTATPYPTPAASANGELGTQRLTSIASDGRAWHNCGVSNQSKLFCWGSGGNGVMGDGSTANNLVPTNVPINNIETSIGNVTDISAGDAHTCAVANGSSYCWGYNLLGRTATTTASGSTWIPVKTIEVAPSEIGGRTVTRTSAGYDHTCAVANSQVLCWGHNADGAAIATNNKLGKTGWRYRVWPMVTSPAYAGASDVSAGQNHSCAVFSARAYCWGQTASGRVGNNVTNTSSADAPTAVQGASISGKTVVQIGAGADFSCARTNEARGVYCWGANGNKQLGNSTYTANAYGVAMPVNTAPLGTRTVTDLSVGKYHACVVASGDVFCWGSNYYGKLALASSVSSTATMQKVALPATATQVSAGYDHTCATLSDNSVYCWGRNSESSTGANGGRIGSGTMLPNQYNTPQKVVGNLAFQKVSAGYRHTCAITVDFKPYCWGLGSLGRLGQNGTGDSATPVPVYTGVPPPEVIIEKSTRKLDTENISTY